MLEALCLLWSVEPVEVFGDSRLAEFVEHNWNFALGQKLRDLTFRIA